MNLRFLLRRGTAAEWQVVNPTLGDAEPGVERDTGRWKLGDGVTPWASLPYQPAPGDAGPVATHASTHATGGSDPLTPTAIGAAPSSHSHPATAISDSTTVGRSVLTAVDAPTARAAIGAGTSSLTLGTTASTAAAGNDARLSDARTPLAHAASHATGAADPITPAAIGAASSSHTHAATAISDSTAIGRSVLTAVDAAAARSALGVNAGAGLTIGTTAGTAAEGNDPRLSDARTPLAHASSHASGGADPITPAAIGAASSSHTHTSTAISDSTAIGRGLIIAADAAAVRALIGAGTSSLALGTAAGTAAAGNDSRLSDARTPLAHTHGVADLGSSGTRSATTFLRGDGAWATPDTDVDSGWQTLTPALGVAGSTGCKYRVRNGWVYVHMQVTYTATWANGVTVATLPAGVGARPSQELYGLQGMLTGGAGEGVPVRVHVWSSGAITLDGRSTASTGFTIGGSFPAF